MLLSDVFANKFAGYPVWTLGSLGYKDAAVVSSEENGGVGGIGSNTSQVRLVAGSQDLVQVTGAEVGLLCTNRE